MRELLRLASLSGAVDMPPTDDVLSQAELLRTRLAKAYNASAKEAPSYARSWRDVNDNTTVCSTGVTIMKHIYTVPELSDGVGDFLYVFQHFALKTANEAVRDTLLYTEYAVVVCCMLPHATGRVPHACDAAAAGVRNALCAACGRHVHARLAW